MRLSLVDDYDDGSSDDISSAGSQDALRPSENRSGSYTNLFDTSQPLMSPVGASLHAGGSPRTQHQRPRDLYDRSPRPKAVKVHHPQQTGRRPPLATPEDSSPTGSPRFLRPSPSINSPGAERSGYHTHSKPPSGQYPGGSRQPPHPGPPPYSRNMYHPSSSMSSQKINGHPIRSSSEERFKDVYHAQTRHGRSSQDRGMLPGDRDGRIHRSQEFLNSGRPSGNTYQPSASGTSRTLPNHSRYPPYVNEGAGHPHDGQDGADYHRPMSFVKALEMSEIVQTKEKDRRSQQKREENARMKSVYDSAYEISV